MKRRRRETPSVRRRHNGPVVTRALNDLKREQLDALRASVSRVGHPFKLWIFVLLFLLSGGIAAVLYAVWTTGIFDRLLGRVTA